MSACPGLDCAYSLHFYLYLRVRDVVVAFSRYVEKLVLWCSRIDACFANRTFGERLGKRYILTCL
jgi:hypothetical protein